MNNIENIADELFNKIRSRFDKVVITDEDGKNTDEPTKARFFSFEYHSSDGTRHGELTISIVDNRSLKATFSQGIGIAFTPEQETEWENFLRSMRMFAKRNMLSFDIRDINRSNLTKRDIATVAKNQSAATSNDYAIKESIQWHGTTRTSIQDFGPTRLIVRHSEAVDESKPGARSRKIESMFIETAEGERFRMPYNKLSLGRAMAQHLSHGGRIYDEPGQHIQGMAEEMNNLAFFVRNTRHRQFEDTETTGMVESAIQRYKQLKDSLNRMSRTRGYHEFAESFIPEGDISEDYDIDKLKERFVKKMFDDRLTAALPYVYRAYQNRQVGEQRFVEEFEDWADHVEHGINESDLDTDTLAKLMNEPIKAGENGIDAQAAIANIIQDDDLNDLILQHAQMQGADADVRKVIDDYLSDNYPEYSSLLQVNASSPVPNQVQNNPASGQEPKENIQDLKKLAGLK
jgi:hypothetical protein